MTYVDLSLKPTDHRGQPLKESDREGAPDITLKDLLCMAVSRPQQGDNDLSEAVRAKLARAYNSLVPVDAIELSSEAITLFCDRAARIYPISLWGWIVEQLDPKRIEA